MQEQINTFGHADSNALVTQNKPHQEMITVVFVTNYYSTVNTSAIWTQALDSRDGPTGGLWVTSVLVGRTEFFFLLEKTHKTAFKLNLKIT